MGTDISEASKRVPIFSFATQGGNQSPGFERLLRPFWSECVRFLVDSFHRLVEDPPFRLQFLSVESKQTGTGTGRQASEFPFSTGELGQNFKAQTRPPGAEPEPWMMIR